MGFRRKRMPAPKARINRGGPKPARRRLDRGPRIGIYGLGMSVFPKMTLTARRLLMGAFVLYLFGLLGYLGPSHRHADGDGRPGAHQDCPLCQISHQPYAAPDPAVCPETPAGPVAFWNFDQPVSISAALSMTALACIGSP